MSQTEILFGAADGPLDGLNDVEFLKAVRWNRNAPKPLVRCAKAGDVPKFTRMLARRRGIVQRTGTGKRATRPAIPRPALWSAAAFEDSARSAELIAIWSEFDPRLKRPKGKRGVESLRRAKAVRDGESETNVTSHRKRKGKGKKSGPPSNWFEMESRLSDWLEGVSAAAPLQPFELLVLFELLPAIGRELSPPLVWKLWRCALSGAASLSTEIDEPFGSRATDDQRVVIAGELPFQAGLLFNGVKRAGRFGRSGAKYLAKQLCDRTDTDGMPHAELLPRLPFWLAGFVRAKQWALAFKRKLWNAETEERFELLVRTVTPLCRADGTLALSNGESAAVVPVLSAAAVASGFQKTSRPRKLLGDLESAHRENGVQVPKQANKALRKRKGKPRPQARGNGRPATQSDWSQLACLRTDWSTAADVLVVAHDGPLPRIDLSVSGTPFLRGEWPLELSMDDEPVPMAGEWECTCWFSDGEVDFIELQRKPRPGVVIDRQMLLSRRERFACLVDCISGKVGKPLAYRSQLPVLPGTEIEVETETRTLQCDREGETVRCYPVALPCDRVHSAPGRFEPVDGRPELSQQSIGGLVAPLVLDWSESRRTAEPEWRTVTVAENGAALPSEQAGGFRLRVGNLHLVIYRQLRSSTEARSILGLHTRHETVIGRFKKSGEIAPLLLVE